jgi:hypothetical protein
MWLPTPIYERIPQFWLLLGLLFIADGLYLGIDFGVAIAYIAVGFICCVYGAGIALIRLTYRKNKRADDTAAAEE